MGRASSIIAPLMSTHRTNTVSSLLVATLLSVANIAYAQDSVPDPEFAAGEPDAGGNAGTGGTSAVAGSGTGGTSSQSTSNAAGGTEDEGGTRVLPGPDMNGCACRVAMPSQDPATRRSAMLLLAGMTVMAARKRR
jgi:hypothetical protein